MTHDLSTATASTALDITSPQAAVRQLVGDDDVVMICGPRLSGSPPP